MIISILLFTAGLIALLKGADWLVDGSSSLAKRLGVSAIVIGLTIVAFGTSAPELVVNLIASISNRPDIAIGNVIGSNITNILLILGIAGAITPLAVQKNTVWKEIPLALLASVILLVMTSDVVLTESHSDTLNRIDGITLLAFFIIFLYYTFGISKINGESPEVETLSTKSSVFRIIAGLGLLILGGKLTVDSAVQIASSLGLSERTIGLTIIAIGTSLPELITSAIAATKNRIDIAVGNIIGSNIFNIFFVLGISSIIRPLPFSPSNLIDGTVSAFATLLLFIAMFIGRRHILEKWQALSFLLFFTAYIATLLLTS